MGLDLLTMDVTSIIFGTFICCVLSFVIYFISAFGTKEKSFEEALEEQKKRSLEEEMQQKQEKGRKDKEKKFKKWNKRKEKIETMESEKVEIPIHDTQTNELVGEIEIIEPRETLQRRKVKMSSKGNAKLENSIPEENDMLESIAKSSGDAKVISSEKRKTEKLPVKEKDVMKVDTKEKEIAKVRVNEQVLAPANEEVMHIIPEVLPVTPSKKKKKEVSDKATDLAGFTVSRLLQFLKEAELGDEESQMMIDVLLNKQKDASEWKKKNDPLAIIKKQLQEKEQAFEVEQSQRQAATTKLKELKQEYAQEKTRASTQERQLQEKVNLQSQEIKVLKQRIKHIQEQFNAEKTSYQEQIHQLQGSFDEKHEAVVKVLQEEKAELQKEVAKLESSVLSKASVNDYETKFENLQKSRDELQKVHNLLVEQHTLLISSHKSEVDKINAQLTEAKRMVNETSDRQRSLIEEVEILRKSCESLEASKCAVEQQLTIARSDKRELEIMQIPLEEAHGKCRNLEAQMFCLSDRVAELCQQNSSQLSQLQYLQEENERLSVELKASLTNDVKTVAHQNGDINEKENELLQKSLAEKEVILEEKEKKLQEIHEELQKQKKQMTVLNHDLEVQKQKNNELREKNWKAMDALSNAEKSAEQKIQDAQKIASEKVVQVQQELEKQTRLVAEKNTLENFCEELKQKVQVAEENLLCYKDEAKKLNVCQTDYEGKIKTLNSELQRLEDLHKLAEKRISDSERMIEGHKLEIAETQKATKQSLQKIFPSVNVDSSLPYENWLSQFEEQASVVLKASSAERSQVDELLEEKSELIKAVQHYKTVLADTECLLDRLQQSAESSELVWKDKLNMKELELIAAIKEKENLISEKEELQSTIQQMGRLEEMQEKLKLLQNTIESSENERAHLQLKYEEVNNNYVNLQDLMANKEQKILELQRNLAILEDTQKELKEIKSKLEKETKINKDLSAQTVKLNSLVKIGQDSLKAEQELVSKLRSELEALKVKMQN